MFIGQWQHVLPSSRVFPMLMPLEWHQFHVTCSKGMNIVWGYCGFMAQYSTALLLQPLLSALLPGSCPQTWQFGFDLSIYRNFIAIWFEPWVDFWHGEDITLQRQWDAKWHHAVYLVAGACLFSLRSDLHKPRPQKAGEKPGPRLWQMQCLWIASQTMQLQYPNHHHDVCHDSCCRKKPLEKLPVLGVFYGGPSLPMAKLVSNEGIPLKQLWHLRIVKVRFEGNIPSPGEI